MKSLLKEQKKTGKAHMELNWHLYNNCIFY